MRDFLKSYIFTYCAYLALALIGLFLFSYIAGYGVMSAIRDFSTEHQTLVPALRWLH